MQLSVHAGYDTTLAAMSERLAAERRQRELMETQDASMIGVCPTFRPRPARSDRGRCAIRPWATRSANTQAELKAERERSSSLQLSLRSALAAKIGRESTQPIR
jgi:hypothetical protein